MVFVLGMTLKFQKFYMKIFFANSHPFPANTRSLKHWCDMTRLGNQNDFFVFGITLKFQKSHMKTQSLQITNPFLKTPETQNTFGV